MCDGRQDRRAAPCAQERLQKTDFQSGGLLESAQASPARMPAKRSNRSTGGRTCTESWIPGSPSSQPSARPASLLAQRWLRLRPVGGVGGGGADSERFSPPELPPSTQPCSVDKGTQSQPLKVVRPARWALRAAPGCHHPYLSPPAPVVFPLPHGTTEPNRMPSEEMPPSVKTSKQVQTVKTLPLAPGWDLGQRRWRRLWCYRGPPWRFRPPHHTPSGPLAQAVRHGFVSLLPALHTIPTLAPLMAPAGSHGSSRLASGGPVGRNQRAAGPEWRGASSASVHLGGTLPVGARVPESGANLSRP